MTSLDRTEHRFFPLEKNAAGALFSTLLDSTEHRFFLEMRTFGRIIFDITGSDGTMFFFLNAHFVCIIPTY